jgi:hypothetical protein
MTNTRFESSPRGACLCVTWSERQRESFDRDLAERLEAEWLTERTRNPWLELRRCRLCGQRWYVATDTVDDDWYFLRLTQLQVEAITQQGMWPADFDEFVNVWPDGDPVRARLSWPWQDRT